ncbi:MAG: alpha/beta hydrolase [Alphaproteobacteria bacterium HGW-Alphaproteobacteria-16]|nr:MAG: alpha/beta hydrolase [Alphaproteobacteria bacterium HGW-Alphaproteobacteria-16]
MRRWRYMLGLTLLSAMAAPPAAAAPREVDDSYTIAQRFDQYKDRYPGIAWPAVTLLRGQEIRFDRAYNQTPSRTLAIDIFKPPRRRNSGFAILLVHGGAWRSGDKHHFYALASRLSQRGHTVFLPEFRLAPEAPYPAGMIDIADALAWVRTQAASFAIQPNRIIVGGASSGGQMAALLAYAGPQGLFGDAGRTSIAALIDLDGVLDFTDPRALQFENAAGPDSPAARWLGGSYEQQPARWREASAASHVGPASPPTLILGSGIARFTVGREKVLTELGRHRILSEAHDFAAAPHDFWLFDPWLPQVAARIDAFIARLPRGQKEKASR